MQGLPVNDIGYAQRNNYYFSPMLKNRGLAFRLSVYLLSSIIIILIALLYYNYVISRDLVLKDAKADALNLTALTVARIESVLSDVENIPVNIVSVIENRENVLRSGSGKVIKEMMHAHPYLYGMSIAFAPVAEGADTIFFAPYFYRAGDTIISKDLAAGNYRYADKPWYTGVRDSGTDAWSEPYFDEGGGEVLMATYSVPFYLQRNGERVFSGVVTADISLAGLQSLIQGIQFYESGFGFLISSRGNIVTWPGIDSVEHKHTYNIFEEVNSPEMVAVFHRMTAGESDIIPLRGMGTTANRERWISFARVPSANWSLGILFHERELYAGIYDLSARLAIIGLAGFVIIGMMIFVIARRFVRPIDKLAHATRRIGSGEFDFEMPALSSHGEIAQLANSFSLMQVELKEYIRNLRDETARVEKMESELQIASRIQQQMLPVRKPVPGREQTDYFGILRPARQIGGDFYDFLAVDGHMYIAIGDVSGKGIPAALFMAKAITLMRAKAASGKHPQQIAAEMSRDLEQYNEQSMFVTLFLGKLDIDSGEIQYTNAGHNPPYLVKNDGAILLIDEVHGLPPGSFMQESYGSGIVCMHPGDKIVLYTDGVTEANNMQGELYGNQRLMQVLNDHGSESPEGLAGTILSGLDAFAGEAEQADDITLFVLEYN
jgi:sigma-B regulation protein RsbU (phosphoserine phosphatase)